MSHTAKDFITINIKFLSTPSRAMTIHSSIYNLKLLKKYCHLSEHKNFSENVLYYQYFLHINDIVYLNKNIFLYQYTINKDKQILYIKNSINKFNDFIKAFNYFLSIPIKNSNKEQITLVISVLRNFIYLMLIVLPQNYNYSDEEKLIIIDKCGYKIANIKLTITTYWTNIIENL